MASTEDRRRSDSVRGAILKQLLHAHLTGDDVGFRKAAIQLGVQESKAGHVRLAEDLRSIIAKMPLPSSPEAAARQATSRGLRPEVADLLEIGYRQERLGDIILPPATRSVLEKVILENRSGAKLERWGVGPRRRLLFFGPPGCGKTLAASVLAGELGLPLLAVRFDALFSRFLGATANHLRLVFSEMPRRPGVYLFDEFDTVAKRRADAHDVGEMRRILTSFLQLLDADQSASLLIAATNHVELLDKAVFRRFDVKVDFGQPTEDLLLSLLELKLRGLKVDRVALQALAHRHPGLSYADATRGCENAIRAMVLDDRDILLPSDLDAAFTSLSDSNTDDKSS